MFLRRLIKILLCMLHERGGEGKDIGVGERRKEERKEGRREGTKKSSMVIGECYSEVRIK